LNKESDKFTKIVSDQQQISNKRTIVDNLTDKDSNGNNNVQIPFNFSNKKLVTIEPTFKLQINV